VTLIRTFGAKRPPKESAKPDKAQSLMGISFLGVLRPGLAGRDDASLLALGSLLASPSNQGPWRVRVAPR
jgi:hypothetical protein